MITLALMIEKILPPRYRIWPIHPLPKKDELLSSWLIRTAHANKFKVHDFYKLYFGKNKQLWNRDIDLFTPPWLIEILKLYFQWESKAISNLTISSYEEIIFHDYAFNRATIKGILNIGVYHRSRQSFGLQYCPLCLKEDLTPYYRKYWRLSYMTICHIHHIHLLDRCSHCAVPIMPHRIDMIKKSYLQQNINLRICAICRKNLTSLTNITTPDQDELYLMKKITYAINHGYIELGDNNNLHSLLFFEGIRTLVQGLARLKRQSRQNIPSKFEFEKSPISLRIELLKIVALLLQNWPSNLVCLLQEIKQPHSTFISKNTNGSAPFWIYKEFISL